MAATAVILIAWVTATPAAERVIDPTVSPADRGRAIAEEVERRDEGFGSSAAELVMTLTNAEGRERTRRLTWKMLEADAPGEGDKSLTVFKEPRDIEGTAVLSHTYVDRDDDQWLYLPSLKRVKRISSANKSSAFVGSEFAYEDLLSDEVEKFDYLWLRNEACSVWQCYLVERRPRYTNSGYARQLVWVDQEEFRPIRIEFYDRKNRHQKTLVFEEYRRYLDRFWRAHGMRMDNHQTGKTTVLSFSAFEFQIGLTARNFDPGVLHRLR
ncbi:MAG TPA: outer membrane lipoprotein-sorting protein [Woeseiaceae bacterium]